MSESVGMLAGFLWACVCEKVFLKVLNRWILYTMSETIWRIKKKKNYIATDKIKPWSNITRVYKGPKATKALLRP